MGRRKTEESCPRPNLYQELTDRIITDLEAGRLPWVQPWGKANAGLGLPANAATGRHYSGINSRVCGHGSVPGWWIETALVLLGAGRSPIWAKTLAIEAIRVNGLRIDKWLWFARCYKTRSLAASMVEAGEVRLNGSLVTKASQPVRVGDILDVPTPTGKRRRRLQVLNFAARRGPAPEAESLYMELDAPCD